MKTTTILLVDYRDFVRRGMKMLLENEEGLTVVGEASNGLDAIEKIEVLMPKVVILDLTMPKMAGIEAVKIISEAYPEVKILIFSMQHDKKYIVSSVENGANGYIINNTSKEELLKASVKS